MLFTTFRNYKLKKKKYCFREVTDVTLEHQDTTGLNNDLDVSNSPASLPGVQKHTSPWAKSLNVLVQVTDNMNIRNSDLITTPKTAQIPGPQRVNYDGLCEVFIIIHMFTTTNIC